MPLMKARLSKGVQQIISMSASVKAASQRISVRLRLGFFVISLLTAVAAFAAIHQARAIQFAQATLNQRGMPMFTLARQIEANLGTLLLQLENLNKSQTQSEIDTIKQVIDQGHAKLNSDVLRFERIDASLSNATSLATRLQSAESAITLLVANHGKQLTLKAALETDKERTSDTLRVLHQILVKMASETALAAESTMHSLRLKGPTLSTDVDRLFTELFLNSITVDAIAQAVEAISSGVAVIDVAIGTNTANRQRLLINAKMQYIVGQLAKLPDTPDRRKLVGHAAALRTQLLGQDGLFDKVETQNRFLKELTAATTAQNAIFDDLTKIMANMLSATLEQVSTTSTKLNDAVQQTIFVIFFGFLSIIATIMLASQFIVENQFTRRITSLTNSVAEIAGGRLDQPIHVKGQDELGDMARALVVFRENARDLRRSNIDLEKFAYVAAHDLRSPLTAISDLSEWINEDTDNTLSVESVAYLTLLQKRTLRLKKLLADLLDYARVGQNAAVPEWVDIPHLISELAFQSDPMGNFDITHDGIDGLTLIPLTAVQQILVNLIENAMKHHDQPTGKITIFSSVEENTLTLNIIDDGPGIDTRHSERVFELFQTLRPRDEVEGSGLGLAIVSKLAERHNGTVTLHSNPSEKRGACFEVRLPLTGKFVSDTKVPARMAS